jgi:hypothetical protein
LIGYLGASPQIPVVPLRGRGKDQYDFSSPGKWIPDLTVFSKQANHLFVPLEKERISLLQYWPTNLPRSGTTGVWGLAPKKRIVCDEKRIYNTREYIFTRGGMWFIYKFHQRV